MSELIARPYTLLPSGQCYDRSEVDAYIAELTSENKLLKERISNGDVSRISWIDEAIEWKAKYESAKATAYTESVDAGMENRRLKRALWLARAWYCGRSSEYFSGMASRCKIGQEDFYREVSERSRRYMKSSYKCRAKAEEYK